MKSISRIAAATVLAGMLVAPMAEAARARIYVRVRPPAAVVETRAVAPGPGYVWIAGYHQWNGTAYAWVPGRWQRPPRRHAHYTAGRWRHDRHGYYWQEGRWH